MIQRIVLMRLLDGSDRDLVAAQCLHALRRLPMVERVEVGTAVGDEADEGGWDVCLLVHLASTADLEPYRVHPEHRALVDQVLMPRMAAIEAYNFTAVT